MGEKPEADLGGDEAAQYAALAEELGAEEGGDDGAEASAEPGTGSGGGGDKSAPEPEAKAEGKEEPLPYEELNRRYQGTQSALREARERERQANEQMRAWNQMVEEMRASRQQAKPEPKAEEKPAAPDPYQDPIGYVDYHLAQIRQEVGASSKTAQELQEQARSRADYQQFMSTVSDAEDAFKATTPDYHDAAQFLEEGRRGELAIMFPDTPQMDAQARANGYQSAAHMRNQIFISDAQAVAANALRAGMNPAQAYYELAKARGYRAAPAQLQESPAAKAAENVIDMARRGKQASKTISGGSGGPENPLSTAELADLYAEDPEEFDRQWDKMARAGRLG